MERFTQLHAAAHHLLRDLNVREVQSKSIDNERRRSDERARVPKNRRNLGKTMPNAHAEGWLAAVDSARWSAFELLALLRSIQDNTHTAAARDAMAKVISAVRFALNFPDGDRKSHQRAAVIDALDRAAAHFDRQLGRLFSDYDSDKDDLLSIGVERFYVELGESDALLARALREHEDLVLAAFECSMTDGTRATWTAKRQETVAALLRVVNLCPRKLQTIKRSHAKTMAAKRELESLINRKRRGG